MNVGAIRNGIAEALTGAGFTVYATVPGDAVLPAAVVNMPTTIEYGTTAKAETLSVSVSLLVSVASETDAQQRLDTAISTRIDGSLVDALRAATSTAWRSIRVVSADNFRPESIGETTALAVDITLELLA